MWTRHPPALHAGILVIEHLDALCLSLERLDLSRNRLSLVDNLGALTGLRELRLGHNQMWAEYGARMGGDDGSTNVSHGCYEL